MRVFSFVASVGRKSAAPSAANCRLRIAPCPMMMVWHDPFCLRLPWPCRFIAAPPSPAARRRCASTPPGTARRQHSDERRNAATPPDLDQAVLHRIEMNVVHMRRELPVVADRVLPVSSQPNAAFAPADHDR